MDALTLDQFSVFVAIVDEGSFAGASRRMGRAQSAITYAIQKLEEQSRVILFDRNSYRPTLTEAGRSLLPHARGILADLAKYRVKAEGIAAGLEAQVNLLVSEALPPSRLSEVLSEFHSNFPTVRLQISAELPNVAMQRLDSGAVDVAIVADTWTFPEWFERGLCGSVPLVAVASPMHPLAKLKGPLSQEVLKDHLQIVLVGRQENTSLPDLGIVAVNRWDVTESILKLRLLLAGIGWGSLPEPLVADDIRASRLVQLEPMHWHGANQLPFLSLMVGYNRTRAIGPAAMALIEAFSGRLWEK